jgi:hypothetical protein
MRPARPEARALLRATHGLSSRGQVRLYCVYLAVGATYIFTNFAVSHTHKDVVPQEKHISWALYSANHTTNCTDSWRRGWLASKGAGLPPRHRPSGASQGSGRGCRSRGVACAARALAARLNAPPQG